jgi:hypothetical protein
MHFNTTHGLSKHPLYTNFMGMHRRASARNNCNVCELFCDIHKFFDWAMSNGYKEGLSLCRNGDIGDYSPDNVRWDTEANNQRESHAKKYKLILNGKEIDVYNLRKYCIENDFRYRSMLRMISGERKTYKGHSNVG